MNIVSKYLKHSVNHYVRVAAMKWMQVLIKLAFPLICLANIENLVEKHSVEGFIADFLSNVIKDFQSKHENAYDVAIVRITKDEKSRKVDDVAGRILGKLRAVTLTPPSQSVAIHRNLQKTSFIVIITDVSDGVRCFIHKSP